MYCSNCARQIDQDAAFCPYCGAPQGGTAQPPQCPQVSQSPGPQPPVRPAMPPAGYHQAGPPATPGYPQPQGYQAPPYGQAPPQGFQPAPNYQQVPPQGYQPAPGYQPPVSYSPAPGGAPAPGYPQQPGYPPPQSYQAAPPAPAPYPPAAAAPARPAPAKHKTTADLLSGAIFLIFGLGAAIYFCLLLATAYGTFDQLLGGFTLSGLFGALADTGGLQRFALPMLLTTVGAVLGLVAGLSLTLGGVFSLSAGRGRKFAFSAVALMVVVLLLDILTLLLMNTWNTLGDRLGPTILASGLIYLFEIAFVVVTLILLAVKKSARQKLFRQTPAAPAASAAPVPPEPAAPQPEPAPTFEATLAPEPTPAKAPVPVAEPAPVAEMPSAVEMPLAPPPPPVAPQPESPPAGGPEVHP